MASPTRAHFMPSCKEQVMIFNNPVPMAKKILRRYVGQCVKDV